MNEVTIRIFMRKWRENMKEQIGVIRTVVDWTVALYVIVPSLLIGIFQYRTWLVVPPDWLEQIPLGLFAVLFAVIASSGQIRSYLDEADSLFLLQNDRLMKSIKLLGAVQSVGKWMLILAALLLLFLPLLRYEMFFSAFIFIAAYQSLTMAVKSYTNGAVRWRRIALKVMTYALSISLFLYVVWAVHFGWMINLQLTILSCCLFVLAGLLIYYRAAKRRYFTVDVEVDQQLKTKLAALILAQSMPQKGTKLRKPWLFRHSKRLITPRTPVNIYGEIAIKSFYRDPNKRNLYLSTLGIGSTAIVLTPLMLKPLVMALLHLYFLPVINKHMTDLQRSDFSEGLLNRRLNEDLLFRCRGIFSKWIHIPAFSLFSGVFLLSLFFISVLRLFQV